jgi:purine-nucleoside phosphorylase
MTSALDTASSLADYLIESFAGVDRPETVIIAGSGLGGYARTVEVAKKISYRDLPGIGSSTVAGHAGELILGKGPRPVAVLAGRRHIYEGIEASDSVRLLQGCLLAWRPKAVIISNAAGGLNPLFEVGDLMLISDHINLMFRNPLIGQNREDLGPRFPDLCRMYRPSLRVLARKVAQTVGVKLQEGVYVGGLGPSYETRAEVGMLRHIFRGDAVGMSTVLEAIACAHLSTPVLGISFISNTLTVPSVTTHEEVMENSRKVEANFSRLVQGIIDALGNWEDDL